MTDNWATVSMDLQNCETKVKEAIEVLKKDNVGKDDVENALKNWKEA